MHVGPLRRSWEKLWLRTRWTVGGMAIFGFWTLPVAATGLPPFEMAVTVARRNGERVVDFAITFIFAKTVRDNERNENSWPRNATTLRRGEPLRSTSLLFAQSRCQTVRDAPFFKLHDRFSACICVFDTIKWLRLLILYYITYCIIHCCTWKERLSETASSGEELCRMHNARGIWTI